LIIPKTTGGLQISIRLAVLKCLTLVAVLSMHLQAYAWGAEGHQVIALLAESQLTSKVRGEVNRLLAQEPNATMASVSTWADEHRNPATAPWHYVNFPRNNCTYVPERDCPDGKCVVAAIQKQVETLGSNTSADKKLLALKYLIHFVGDVHQPLHAGYGDDRGGNSYQLQAFMRGSNLHAVWDSGLIRNLDQDPGSLMERLSKEVVSDTRFDLTKAAEESCRIVAKKSFYPDRLVDAPYIEEYTPVMEQRLAIAGARLASLLNGLFH
jgi:hypothetical protein